MNTRVLCEENEKIGIIDNCYESLKGFCPPEATSTFTPLSHYDIATSVIQIGKEIFHGYDTDYQEYYLSRKGALVFGFVAFGHYQNVCLRKPSNKEFDRGIVIAFVNSYDKSLSTALLTGAFIMGEMLPVFASPVLAARRHSKNNTLDEMKKSIIPSIFGAKETYANSVTFLDKLLKYELTDQQALELLGVLWSVNALTPKQLANAKRNWFERKTGIDNICDNIKNNPQTALGLYCCCLKTINNLPHLAFKQYTTLHSSMSSLFKE